MGKIHKRIASNIDIVTTPIVATSLVYVVNPSYYHWVFNEGTGLFYVTFNIRFWNRVSCQGHIIWFFWCCLGTEVVLFHYTCTPIHLKGANYLLVCTWKVFRVEIWVPFLFFKVTYCRENYCWLQRMVWCHWKPLDESLVVNLCQTYLISGC